MPEKITGQSLQEQEKAAEERVKQSFTTQWDRTSMAKFALYRKGKMLKEES